MYPGYLNVGCNEIINNERAATYAAEYGIQLNCDRCEALPEVLGHAPYSNPAADDAPWYDPIVPESVEFLGVWSNSGIDGLGMSTLTQGSQERSQGGGVPGAPRRAARDMTVVMTLVAASECALVYGLGWLSRALGGDSCSAGCRGMEMAVFACCPTAPDDGSLRYLYDVGVARGVQSGARQYAGDGLVLLQVTVNLFAGNPWIYSDPLAGEEWVPLGGGELVRQDPDQVYQRCLEPEPCATDPLCPPPILPPAPPAPVSPCYGMGVAEFRVTRLSVAADEYPAWTTLVPVIEVEPGGADMRRLLVRFWANPAGGECGVDELDPCDSCGDANVSYVPAESVLTIDGRTERSQIACETEFVGTALARPDLYGQQGGLYRYPYFPCPSGLCVEVWSLATDTSEDARARVLLVPRTDVI
ncbi:hypothetical protein [Streptomyces sp. NBRC 109706]|uniref:hypothetical protein n=1 Tax=Streptomyces sp. NBRC 109706 TaxID=1550035 RepID=UPI000784344D|nr:hypothetical protein [Streptomyces sp. NBRC 109706]